MSAGRGQASNGGIGFTGLLTVALIVLKLLGVIAWSWWWVLAPLWIGAVIGLLLAVMVFVAAFVVTVVKA